MNTSYTLLSTHFGRTFSKNLTSEEFRYISEYLLEHRAASKPTQALDSNIICVDFSRGIRANEMSVML